MIEELGEEAVVQIAVLWSPDERRPPGPVDLLPIVQSDGPECLGEEDHGPGRDVQAGRPKRRRECDDEPRAGGVSHF